jgi:hypothetical protein
MASHSHSARTGSVIFVCSQCHLLRLLSLKPHSTQVRNAYHATSAVATWLAQPKGILTSQAILPLPIDTQKKIKPDAPYWQRLHAINRDIIGPDANQLQPGTKIRIPTA